MGRQKYIPSVKHTSNCLYHEQDKTRKAGSKDKTKAIRFGRILKWIFGIRD